MPDNTTLNPGVGGDVILTEDIGGNKMPVSKLRTGDHGTDGGDVTATNPLPVEAGAQSLSSAYPLGQSVVGKTPLSVDSFGNLQVRAAILTDEGSLIDSFDDMSEVLTGTITFLNGSDQIVGGIGANFLNELDEYRYVKLDVDDETHWVQVGSVEDASHATLATAYLGSSATGAASSSYWSTQTAAGGSITTVNCVCVITSPGTGGSVTGITHQADYAPMFATVMVSVSQRVANEVVRWGFVDNLTAPTMGAWFEASGTDKTEVACCSSFSAAPGASLSTTYTIPKSATSDMRLLYEVRWYQGLACYYCNGVPLETRRVELPESDAVLAYVAGIVDAAPTTAGTVLTIDSWTLNNLDTVEVVASQPDASKFNATVVGPDMVGQPASSNPTGNAGKDPSGNVQWLRVDARGGLFVAPSLAQGSYSANENVWLMGGADSFGLAQELRIRELAGRNELSVTDQSVITCLSDLQTELARILQGGGDGALNVRINDPAPITGIGQVGCFVSGYTPILNGAIDTTGKLRTLLSDVLGRLNVVASGVAAPAAVIGLAGNPLYMGLSDATNVRAVLGDTSGRPIVVGGAASGSSVAGNPVLIAGSDGTNARTFRLDAAGELYLVCDAAPAAAVPAAIGVVGGVDRLAKVRTIATDQGGQVSVTNDGLSTLLQGIQDRLDTMIGLLRYMTGSTD